jgi:hypothetical protein
MVRNEVSDPQEASTKTFPSNKKRITKNKKK